MYTDMLLFLIGGICALLTLSFVAYLIISGKRSRSYQAYLKQETEIFDALSTTDTYSRSPSAGAYNSSQGTSNTSAGAYNPSAGAPANPPGAYNPSPGAFDASALEGRYIIRQEIHGGGMSRVFLADSAKLGNQWIVKFISNKHGALANEENILKLLNHISLPKIIDIFRDDRGIYIVESYIEGISLDKVMGSGRKVNQSTIADWAEQLAQVLSYLHSMTPHPIYHLDLKPSNIMVTHDNRLVLIDFGISKRFGADNAATVGITYKYAAPEQIKFRVPERYVPLVSERFGQLPPAAAYWNPDARSDIYSL